MSTGVELETVAATAQEPELLAVDRCDSCGVGAQIRVTFLTGMLLFCGHHGRKFRDGFEKQAVSIFDPNQNLPVIIIP